MNLSPTNSSDIERLLGAPLGAFNTANSSDIKSGIKEEFERVVAPYISAYSATIEEGLRGAFLSSIIGLIMIELFRAPAMNADIIYDNDFIGSVDDLKKGIEIQVKGFEYAVVYVLEYDTGVRLITTQNITLECFGKARKKGFIFGTGAATVAIMTGFLYGSSVYTHAGLTATETATTEIQTILRGALSLDTKLKNDSENKGVFGIGLIGSIICFICIIHFGFTYFNI